MASAGSFHAHRAGAVCQSILLVGCLLWLTPSAATAKLVLPWSPAAAAAAHGALGLDRPASNSNDQPYPSDGVGDPRPAAATESGTSSMTPSYNGASSRRLLGVKPLRILAVGDSLFEGWAPKVGQKYYWPQNRLGPELAHDLQTKVTVTNVAVGGSRVLGALPGILSEALKKGKYDLIMIMAGINDIMYPSPANAAFPALKGMIQQAQKSGAAVLVGTILETALWPQDAKEYERQKYNDMIRSFAWESTPCAKGPLKPGSVYLIDTSRQVPYYVLSSCQRSRFSDDGTHLTKDGYELLTKAFRERIRCLVLPSVMNNPICALT